MAFKKSPAEIEAEEALKKIQDNIDKGTSGDGPAPVIPENETPEAKAEREKAETEAKRIADEAAAAEAAKNVQPDTVALTTEVERLKGELAKEESARGRLTAQGEEMRGLKEQIGSMQAQIVELMKTKQPDPPKVDEVEKSLVESYGEDSQAVAAYRAQRETTLRLEEQISGVKSDVESVKKNTAMTARERFLTDFKTAVPDYAVLFDDPDFLKFLSNKESEFSDVTLATRLSEADAANDIKKGAAIYNAFKKTKAPAGDNGNAGDPPTKDKEKLLAPGADGKGASVIKDKPHYSPEEIDNMGKEIIRLRRMGDIKEADAIKAKIDAFVGNFSAVAK